MSKYGTIPASSSPAAPTSSESSGSTTALDVTCGANVPGSCAASRRRRPWRELADPSALSVPEGFADAYHRARANLAHFADNYKLVFLVVLTGSLLWSRAPFRVSSMVLPCFLLALAGAKVFPVHLALTLLLLVLVGATASVLVSMPVGLLLVLIHAVLLRPTDSVDDEEAGRGRGSAAQLPSTDCSHHIPPRRRPSG